METQNEQNKKPRKKYKVEQWFKVEGKIVKSQTTLSNRELANDMFKQGFKARLTLKGIDNKPLMVKVKIGEEVKIKNTKQLNKQGVKL